MTATEAVSSELSRQTQRRRVLWLTKGLGRGGAERLLVSTAKRIDQARFDIEVAYVLPHKDALAGELTAAGIPVRCLSDGSGGRGWVRRLRGLLADRRYELVHTHSPVAATAARLTAPRHTRLLHTEHNVWPRYRLPTRLANAITFGRNVRALAVSDGVAASMRPPRWRRLPGMPPVETLTHGIDPETVLCGDEARRDARDRLGLDDDEPVVGTVGNLTPKKDHRTLLQAVARLDGPLAGTKVVICGDGPLADELHRESTRLGLQDRALLLGSRDDVPALLPGLDVFAMPSLHEGLSIALVEALASRVPCVVTDVGGLPEVVTDGVEGRIVAPQDPDALAAALLYVLSDPDQHAQMAAAAQTRAKDFSIDPAAARLQAIYDEVLA